MMKSGSQINPVQNQSGFSLVELIIVIVISGILASMTASVLQLPIKAYVDSARRATLTDAAESTIRRMQRDIRRALPNSIRISPDQSTLELLHIVDGGRYRSTTNNTVSPPTGNILDFTLADTSADVLGSLANFTDISLGTDRLVIYPLNSTGSNPYAGDNTTALLAGSTASLLNFTAFQFPLKSPEQRFFIIDTPITYGCDTSAALARGRVLFRYQDYAIQAAQPIPPAVTPAVQSNYLSACTFSYNSGSSTRSAVVTIALTLTDDAGESVNLIHQVHVDNQP